MSTRESKSLKVILEHGHERVLARAPLLEHFAARCGQSGAMHWMRHFLSVPNFRGRRPYILLVMSTEAHAENVTSADLLGAVLLFEHRLLGLPTRLFCTDDISGFRTVLAPASERHAIAAIAADYLLSKGAQYLLMAYDAMGHPVTDLRLQREDLAAWAGRTRSMPMSLVLEPTLEKTLAKLGKSTRFNLGYYRRRLEAEMPCDFIADARGMLREDELDDLNQNSLNVISNTEFRLRYRSASELPGGFLLGLRARDNRWISLIGGWRQEDTAVLHWQMNAAGYERMSLGTAMRSYYLEHESNLGTKRLAFYHGTPHAMHRSFEERTVQELFVRRESLRAKALCWLVNAAATRLGLMRNGQLFQALLSGDWAWATRPADLRPAPGNGRSQAQ